MSPLISVVVPCRFGEDPSLTLDSLKRQTLQDFEVHLMVDAEGRGAPWARNAGSLFARGEFLLFSDDDIAWQPDALETMLAVLRERMADEAALTEPDSWTTGYAYGGYIVTKPDGTSTGPHGNELWDFRVLQGRNFVSTMSLMLRSSFMGFDESLARLQDWEMWLRMAQASRIRGEWVGRVLFSTPERVGITVGGSTTYEEAWAVVRRKRGLPV